MQLLIHLSPSNVAPVEMIQPLRPAEMRMLTCMVVRNSCEGVGKRRGGGGCADDACLTAVREDMYVWSDKRLYVFPGCVFSDGGNLCDCEKVGRMQQAVPAQVVYPDTDVNFDNSLLSVLLGRLKSVKHE